MNKNTIYDERNIPTVVNGVGTRTQVSGARLRSEAREAMKQASSAHVYLTDLQAYASEQIAPELNADAALVTAGTTAGLVLATGACIARDNYGVMAELPDTDAPSEIIIPRSHHCKYDVAFRVGGGTLIDVGPVSHHPVDGGTDLVRPWQIDDAINDDTAAVAYLARPYNRLPLEDVVDVAHDADVPVIVDAAGETHPPAQLRSFLEVGADLVAFSGGKRIRGPQSSGVLVGRDDLIQSAAVQSLSDGYHRDVWSPPTDYIEPDRFSGVPPNGIGRSMKVDKETLIGLVRAFECYIEEDHVTTAENITERAERVADRIDESDAFKVYLTSGDEHKPLSVVAELTEASGVSNAATLIRRLRREKPRVWVGESRIHLNQITVDATCLTDPEASFLAERVVSVGESVDHEPSGE